MTSRTVRWGFILLVFAAVLIAACTIIAVQLGPQPGRVLVQLALPATLCALSLSVFFAGRISYPRVQNLRVYLAGYSVAVLGLAYGAFKGFAGFFTDALPLAPAGYEELVLALAIVGSYLYSLLPEYPTFRTTRLVTFVIAGVEIAILTLTRFFPASFFWIDALAITNLVSVRVALIATFTVAVVVINALLPAQGYYLRGAFSGLALIAGAGWVLPSALSSFGYLVSPVLVYLLHMIAAPILLAVSILIHVLARMDHRVSYDPLLQVYNREFAEQVLGERSFVPTRPPLAVMMIDIDHFKRVNDAHGHQAGDKVLFSVAQMVQRQLVPDGIVCRYGGEELIVFFPGRTGRDVVPLAKRLREVVEGTETAWQHERIGVTVSIGLSDRKHPRQPLGHVVQAADKALYIAKENGRNQVRFVRIKDQRKAPR